MSVKQLMTADDLAAMPEVPGSRFELVDGELVEVPGATLLHGLIAALVYEFIQNVVRQRNLGLVVNDGVTYVLRRDPDLVRIPDVSFISWDSMPRDVSLERFYEGAPTLAVEIVSPDDRASELREKARDYLDAGVREVWILWPRLRAVTVYAVGSTRDLELDDELSSEDLLPGFRVPVSALFEVPSRP